MNKQVFGMEMDDDVDVSSSDDEESSEDENRALEQRAEEIERDLSSNVFLYDLHLELVDICEKTGDLLSLRLAYERFAETYPLTGTIWLKWIKVEATLATTDEDKKKVIELYERGTKDYLSVKLWLEYVQFAMSNLELKETLDILERALSVAGLHYTDASLLWDILRELEFAHLSILPKDGADADNVAYSAQLRKLVDAYRRQLSVALLNIESTYEEWQQLVEQLPPDSGINTEIVENVYQQALKTVELYKPYEERLLVAAAGTDDELYAVYKEYIKSVKDPSLISCLYERAVEKLCLTPQVWTDYITYTLKLGDVADSVSQRALRNVTWHESLWCLRLKILEKHDAAHEELLKCFELGVASLPSQAPLDLWLDFIAYTKRSGSPERLEKLLEQAEQAVPDDAFKIARFHARHCAKADNMPKARELWNAIMSTAKNLSQFWLEYASLERRHGSIAHARGVFIRAMSCNTDWPQVVADEWTMFEREEGTLEDAFRCMEKIAKLLPDRLKAQALQLEQAAQAPSPQSEVRNGKRKHDAHAHEGKDKHVAKKTKFEKNAPMAKNQGIPNDLDPDKSVFVSNLSPTVGVPHLATLFPNGKVTLATNNKAQSRCFAYVQFATPEEAQSALGRDREHFESRPIFISKCKTNATERQATFKFSNKTENNKLFVRGLPVAYAQEDVEKLFKPFNCTQVRVVQHRSGRSKGLAYVDFANEDDAEKALKAMDNSTVEQFLITVAISAPPQKGAKMGNMGMEERPHEVRQHARSRLQMPFIPRAAMKQQTQMETHGQGGTSDSNNSGGGAAAGKKSNNDFRNMLLNKN